MRKRGHKVELAQVEPKRIKLDNDDEPKTEDIVLNIPKITRIEANNAIDVTADDLVERLRDLNNVSDLVLVALLALPDTLPVHFQSSFTPVAAAGTDAQTKHLARLLATQLTAAGMGMRLLSLAHSEFAYYRYFICSRTGKGVTDMIAKMNADAKSAASDEQQQKIAAIIGRSIAQELRRQEQQQQQAKVATPTKVKLVPTGKALTTTVRFKQLNLADITTAQDEHTRRDIVQGAVDRILKVDNSRLFLSTSQRSARVKILSHLCAECKVADLNLIERVKAHVFQDIRNRYDMLFNVLYNEYLSSKIAGDDLHAYNVCFDSFLTGIIECEHRDRAHFLPKFFNEAPLITAEALAAVRDFIIKEGSAAVTLGMTIIKTLLQRRRLLRQDLMALVLELSVNMENAEARQQAVKTIKLLHKSSPELRETIEEYAHSALRHLLEPTPPAPINNLAATWSEDAIKLCLMPYLSLLPNNHSLIHNLAVVYVSTQAEIKRVILRALEAPVRAMGMNSPELLLLLENCPKGAETMVARMIHVLTDKQAPSAELVSRVRDLYQKRVPDVRFLIPVLNGLTKKEVIAALPKLIKLNPVVVKEVFNRLLGVHGKLTAID